MIKLSHKLRATCIAAAVFVFSELSATFAQQATDEPIGFTGHGAMFDGAGNQITPTPEFIGKALAYYESQILSNLPEEQKAEFQKMRSAAEELLVGDALEQVMVQANLVEWLAKIQPEKFGDKTLSKVFALKRSIGIDAKESGGSINAKRNVISPEGQERIKNLRQMLQLSGGLKPKSLTSNSGDPYRQECLDNDVPVPVDFGPAWTDHGQIPQNKMFIVSGLQATVKSMVSADPPGLCVALPRHGPESSPGAGDGLVQLDGIICMGQVTNKVCFFDNQDSTDPDGVFTFPLNNPPPVSQWLGGAALDFDGTCSDCHAGENPYIIHPNRPGQTNGLGNLAAAISANLSPNDWHDPIIQSPWPENPGPMNSPPSCDFCHGDADDADKGFAGRLPHISTFLPGYCGSILRAAVGAKNPLLTVGGTLVVNPLPTMPSTSQAGALSCTPTTLSSSPNFRACNAAVHTADCTPSGAPAGSVSCTPELANLLAWCGTAQANDASSRGDPHLLSLDGVSYDFQSGGEFTYLRGPEGFEVQARQTPVPTASAPPPNQHTGLQSCVSINTAVAVRLGKHKISIQQPLEPSEKLPPAIRIDGELVNLDTKAFDLGNGASVATIQNGQGVSLSAPDGTQIEVTSNWWGLHQLRYMNVDVRGTSARDGVLGSIAPTGWLPALSDGSSLGAIPASMAQRFSDLNVKFADSWRVNELSSLFDYLPGQSTKDYTFAEWPPETPICNKAPGLGDMVEEPIDEKKAMEICGKVKDRVRFQQCVFDVSATGEPGFAQLYANAE